MFSVHLWPSHPDAGNDDCWTGDNFQDEAEARLVFADPARMSDHVAAALQKGSGELWVELTGPDGLRDVRRLRAADPVAQARQRAQDQAMERAEWATQLGMGLGVNAFNDAMGG